MLGGFIAWFPCILETKKERFNAFKPVLMSDNPHPISFLEKRCKNENETNELLQKIEESIKTKFKHCMEDNHKKYKYLSENMVETNAHVLGLYKKIKILESENLLSMKMEIDEMKQQFEESTTDNKIHSQSNENISTQTDIVYLFHKLEKMTEKIANLESNLKKSQTGYQNGSGVVHLLGDNGKNVPQSNELDICVDNGGFSLQSNLLKIMLPSVVTVTAIVINMYLYISSVRRFPY